MPRYPAAHLYSTVSSVLTTVLLLSCSTSKKENIEIQWKENRATEIVIYNFTGEKDSLKVRLTKLKSPSIFGSSRTEGDHIIFEPLVPFTPGLEYSVCNGVQEIGRISIPLSHTKPELIGIYPADTVPENLLKIHLEFSQPMREGQSLTHITWYDGQGDTLKNILLYLKTELWNPDRTLLTLWLDPGRIKRGLQPNESLGAPLQKEKKYVVKIDSLWEGESGVRLVKSYSTTLWVIGRDSLLPKPANWKVSLLEKNTIKPIIINFFEDLDYSLITDCISIHNSQGKPVPGSMHLDIRNQVLQFIPQEAWHDQKYFINIESRLEDVAGNNLNRPFDRNIKSVAGPEKEFHQIEIKYIK